MISFTSMRKERILRCWGIILPVALLIYIMLCRFLPGCARGYADYVYPNVSFVLSAVSSVIPVSWEEIMAVVVVSLMIFIPVMARRRGAGGQGSNFEYYVTGGIETRSIKYLEF